MSRFPPTPPEASTTAPARTADPSSSSTPITESPSFASPLTVAPKRMSSAERRGSAWMAPHTASTSALPHPRVRWKRGTELPSPCTPRSAQFTTGKKRTPCDLSQPPTSSRARATYCSAQRRGHSSSGSKSAIRIQSSSASSTESGIFERRCSGVSTMNMPPNASRASPPTSSGLQRSISRTSRPCSSSSSVATSPAIPPPTTITSAMWRRMFLHRGERRLRDGVLHLVHDAPAVVRDDARRLVTEARLHAQLAGDLGDLLGRVIRREHGGLRGQVHRGEAGGCLVHDLELLASLRVRPVPDRDQLLVVGRREAVQLLVLAALD